MEQRNLAHSLLLDALRNIFGAENAALIIRYLEQENVIQNDTINAEEIEPALKEIFGQGAVIVVNTLLLVAQKKARSSRQD